MKYKGVNLVLDNFRSVLKEYSVDVQDVVRSALLDGISLEKYISKCKNNPYRLEQIRLGLKEGINEKYFEYQSGEVIRGIRTLLKKGVDVSPILKYTVDSLSDKCFLYLICWCKDGYDVSHLNLSIVPDYLLEFFDYCIRNSVDVKSFNNGKQYSIMYTDLCIKIIENGLEYDKYSSGDYSIEVLEFMSKLSDLPLNKKYVDIYGVLNESMSLELLKKLEKASSLGMDLSKFLMLKDESKEDLVLEAKCNNIDLLDRALSMDDDSLRNLYFEKSLEKDRPLSGKLGRKRGVVSN